MLLVVYSFTAVYPELFRPLFWLFGKLGDEGKGVAYMKTFTMEQIQGRIKEGEKGTSGDDRDTMAWFAKRHRENPERFTLADLYLHASASFIAGSDTTSATMSAVFYFLHKNPRTLTIVRKEIEEATRTGLLSDPVKYDEAQQLPYFQAVLKESLRMFPVTGIPSERVVPAGGATVAGTHFPEGVSRNIWLRGALRPTVEINFMC